MKVICKNCKYVSYVGYGDRCMHPERLHKDYITGKMTSNLCVNFNQSGECKLYEKSKWKFWK